MNVETINNAYNILSNLSDKYYRTRKGKVRVLICKDTKKEILTGLTEEEFCDNVEKFFR